MGRTCQTQPPVPVEFIRECFDLRDGVLIGRERPQAHFQYRLDDWSRWNNLHAGKPIGFAGPDGRLMARLQFQGATRRIAATRVAWALAFAAWPRGQIKPKNGDEGDLRPENLQLIQRGANPAAVGRSSLARRRAVDGKLIEALAVCSARDGPATVAEIGELAELTESGASARLGMLAAKGLAISPQCVPGRSWCLTERGRELAATGRPVIDDLDQEVLTALALVPMGIMKLARRVAVCPMTIRRRVRLLVERGLVFADPRRFFAITDQGRQAIGPDARPAPWVNVERIRASSARDVRERHDRPPDDRTAEFRARIAKMGAQASMTTARLRKTGIGHFAPGEFDRAAAG